jgi:DNA-binding transcriptional LysR family regulator
LKRLPPLNALKVFAAAAEAGSFTLAGESLHVTQGAVSRQVKQLETSMGVALFTRQHQKVELTPSGRELATTLLRLFDEMEHAVQKAAGLQRRQLLRLNAPPTFATRWLAPRLSNFSARFPLIDVSVTTDILASQRVASRFDCFVTFSEYPWPKATCDAIFIEHHIMASSPALWTKGKPPKLANATLLHVLDVDRRLPVWEHWLATHGPKEIDARPGLNFSTLDQAINAAVSGAGIVIVDSAMVHRELQTGALLRHQDKHLDGPCGYWFVDPHKKSEAAPRVSAFRHWLAAQTMQATAT